MYSKSLSIILSIFFLLINDIHTQQLYKTPTSGVGGVYTMTNGLTMNQVIVYRLSEDGHLTWVRTVNTDGIGANTPPIDPLLSQGPITVYSNYLFLVNAGSNSLSMFMINPSDATELTLISVQSVYGWFPMSVTVNSMYACVLTSGNVTGIRCFTYNSSGLYVMSSFDRDLTSYVSQSVPPKSPPGTFSQILFSPDDLTLIISVKGHSRTARGYLLLFQLSKNGTQLSLNPTLQTPKNGILPYSLTPIGMNGLLITDPAAEGVMTLTYSSTSGLINNNMFTPVDSSIAGALCWSTYSPIIGNYYVIGVSPAAFVELHVDLNSSTSPVQIIRYYPVSENIGALDATVVSLLGTDYFYVLGPTAQVISVYRLNTAGNAVANGTVAAQQGNMTEIPKIAGIAAFIQTKSP